MTFLSDVGGFPVQRLDLWVPSRGAWVVDALLAEAQPLSGVIACHVGSLVLSGTVDPRFSGSWESARRVRVVAGGNGWGKVIPRKSYHSDLGVKAATVAKDAAQAAGESLGAFAPGRERIGATWVREEGAASAALEWAAGGVPWWVGYDGRTNVCQRTESVASGYSLLTYDSTARIARLSADDPAAVGVGSILTDRLDTPQTVRGYHVSATPAKLSLECWCGGEASSLDRFARALRAIAGAGRRRLHGRYRYRVMAMSGDRVTLEPVRRDLGLDPIGPVDMRPGVAGAWASLPRGTEVVVSFLDDGDPGQPCVEGFAPKGGECFVPSRLELCVGPGETGSPVACVGDTVTVALPSPMTVSGVFVGAPGMTGTGFTGTIIVTQNAVGVIDTGTPRILGGRPS